MKWFKHYSTLSEKDFSQRLIQKHGLEAYARYLILLEICAATHGDRHDGKYAVSKRLLSSKLAASQWRLSSHLVAIADQMDFKLVETEFEFIFDIPILAELQHKDSVSYKKRRASGGPDSGHVARLEEDKEEDKEKEIESTKVDSPPQQKASPQLCGAISEFSFDSDCKKLLAGVTHDSQRRWLKLYVDQEFLKREFIKMADWLEINPSKKPRSPRGLSLFISRWLGRGWETHRKSIPTKKEPTLKELLAQREKEREASA